MNDYDKRMVKMYFNICKNKFAGFKHKLWHKINRKLLKTYLAIEDCCRCQECGRNAHDFSVPNELWKEVAGSYDGVLCYDCFCDLAQKKNIKWRNKYEIKNLLN